MPIIIAHLHGSRKGREDKLDQELIRLGRKADNHIVFSEVMVSSHHAEVRSRGGSYLLVDLESTNGTFLNGKRVQEERLRDGDQVQLGKDGPVFAFRAAEAREGGRPRIVPLSGAWEHGKAPMELPEGRITLGRGQKNDIVVGRTPGSPVSSEHAEIRIRGGHCELEDLGSTNGTFVNGHQVRAAELHDGDRVELGKGGPEFEFRGGQGSRKAKGGRTSESEQMFRKLEHAARGGPAGDRTMMILQAAQKYYKRRRWPLLVLAGIVLLAAVGISIELYRKNRQLKEQTLLAESVFYQMRTIEAQLVQQHDSISAEEFQNLRNRRMRLEQDYDRYLENLGLYTGKSPVEQAVMRLARRLGETDLEMPPDFQRTVMEYIERWRSTPRLRTALDRAGKRSLPKRIRIALDQYGLPPEFMFLALQESDFDTTRVGPPTRFGFAKGMWQFIPKTAAEFGLSLGPLKDVPQYDLSDQRHDENRATQAAARYLAYLYSTKAAASGLLVIASYNYGQTRIIEKLDQLPNDPRQRSFWNFYRNGWIPPETRDYVMYIFSAALICEKPDLFNISMAPIDTMW
jgi:pSer/pThr/pTyr-binding forkhead associated (FHA) protein